MNFGQRCFSYFKTFSKKNFIGKCIRVAVPTRIMAYAVTFSFEDEDKLDITKNIPDKPIEIPSSDLSHEFLMRNSSILSEEAASRLLMFVVATIDSVAENVILKSKELANLYEMSSGQYTLSEAGENKIMTLRQEIDTQKQYLNELELLFEYTKKLMDSNAEVCYLLSEEHASTQASQKIHSASEHVTKVLNAIKAADLDLIVAQKTHIENNKIAENDLL